MGCFGPMNGENRPLVTDEPVEFEKQLVSSSRLQEDYSSIQNNLWNKPQINEEKQKDVNS